jgi:hypothetical protein
MGSGAKAHSKRDTSIEKNNFVAKNSIKPEKIINLNGNYYYNLNRNENKLSNDVLSAMSRFNNFSRDTEEDEIKISKSIKNKLNNKNKVV